MTDSGVHMRLVGWASGAEWGFRSIDGYSQPDSAKNRKDILSITIPIIAGVTASNLLAASIYAISGGHTAGLNAGRLVTLLLLTLVVPVPVGLYVIRRLPAWGLHGVLASGEVGLFPALAIAAGPELSPFAGLAYLVIVVLVFLVFPRRAAVLHGLAVGASYGFVLFYQRGNTAPLARWVMVMGSVLIVGATVARLVERLRGLALSERRARHDAEAAKQMAAELTRTLERRVKEQVEELERLGRLRRFLSTPVADVVLSADPQAILAPHRREIAVFFCDLRGFTSFTASAEPEEVIMVLDDYFDILGVLIGRYDATVGAFTGDGLMAIFNDPLPCPDPATRAVKMAMELRTAMQTQTERWHKRGYDLDFGVGIALGYANLGMIGFEGRRDYSAFGLVVNLASRLCAAAGPGQVLIDQRAYSAAQHEVEVDGNSAFTLKGFHKPVPAFSVVNVNRAATLDGGSPP